MVGKKPCDYWVPVIMMLKLKLVMPLVLEEAFNVSAAEMEAPGFKA